MGLLLGSLAALFGSGIVVLFATRKNAPTWLRLEAPGLSVLVGMTLASAITAVVGQSYNLVTILTVASTLIAVGSALLLARGIHLLWRLAVHVAMFAATLAFLYWRGDLYAFPAAVSVILGVLVLNVFTMAVAGADRSRARVIVPMTFLLGAGYLIWIAVRLPNPGLLMFVLFTAATMVPLFDRSCLAQGVGWLFGPTLGSLAWASGFYAWLGNASVPMVLAPVTVIGADVLWTVLGRLLTKQGRTRLATAGSWWRRIDGVAAPGEDLVCQRMAGLVGLSSAALWFIGATLFALALGVIGWYLRLGPTIASVPLILLAVVWILAPLLLARRAQS